MFKRRFVIMRTNVIVASFILVCIGGIVAVPNIWVQDSTNRILKDAESLLRATYEGGEFRSGSVRFNKHGMRSG